MLATALCTKGLIWLLWSRTKGESFKNSIPFSLHTKGEPGEVGSVGFPGRFGEPGDVGNFGDPGEDGEDGLLGPLGLDGRPGKQKQQQNCAKHVIVDNKHQFLGVLTTQQN